MLRIVLSFLIIILLWTRIASEWRDMSVLWILGNLALSVILLLVVIMEVAGARRQGRKQRDEVPKHPLGLDT